MQASVRQILKRRRDRSIYAVMSVAEEQCGLGKGTEAHEAVRRVVMNQFNVFHDLVVDVMESMVGEGPVLNEVWLEKLEEIHQAVVG